MDNLLRTTIRYTLIAVSVDRDTEQNTQPVTPLRKMSIGKGSNFRKPRTYGRATYLIGIV